MCNLPIKRSYHFLQRPITPNSITQLDRLKSSIFCHSKFQKVAIFYTDSPSHVALSEGEERGDGDADHEQRSISLVLD